MGKYAGMAHEIAVLAKKTSGMQTFAACLLRSAGHTRSSKKYKNEDARRVKVYS